MTEEQVRAVVTAVALKEVKRMRTINADALDDVISRLNEGNWGITRGEYKLIDRVIFEFPTIEPERKKGKWIEKCGGNDNNYFECSKCGCLAPSIEFADKILWKLSNYCPDCGAKMEKKKEFAFIKKF